MKPRWIVIARTDTFFRDVCYKALSERRWTYRYLWMARWRARHERGSWEVPGLSYRTQVFIEPYHSGENIIPLRRSA